MVLTLPVFVVQCSGKVRENRAMTSRFFCRNHIAATVSGIRHSMLERPR